MRPEPTSGAALPDQKIYLATVMVTACHTPLLKFLSTERRTIH